MWLLPRAQRIVSKVASAEAPKAIRNKSIRECIQRLKDEANLALRTTLAHPAEHFILAGTLRSTLEQHASNQPRMALQTDPEATRLALLSLLAQRPELSQRELSLALNVSLGKTHYVLHALLDKGLVKASNFKRSDQKMAYAYLLTPAGLREKLRLTRSFLARKEAEFEHLQTVIANLRAEVEKDGLPR